MRNYLHYCYLILIVLILTVLTEQQAQASRAQVMGGDISYWCVDTNEYKFAVNLYYYCVEEGIAPIPQISLQVVSKTLGIEDTLILLPSIKKEVTPVCSAYKDSTSCQNPNSKYPGVKQHIYHSYGKSITLSAADDWTISFVENGRNLDNNNGITNLDTTTVSADKDLFYLYAKINNSNPTQCTDSLAFATSPIPFYCNNTAAEFKQGVTHSSINGNYLKYTSINPLAEGATAITYQSGFNENQPLEAHTYHFDPRTGDINFTPSKPQASVMTILVEEFAENGTLLGAVTRDVQIVVVEGCSLNKLNLREPNLFFQDGCVEEQLTFDIHANDLSGSDITIQTNIDSHFPAINLPNLTITPNNNNLLNATFDWTPTADDVGEYTLLITLSNNECPIPATLVESISIWVAEPGEVKIEAPTQYCRSDTDPLILYARGCGPFSWSAANSNDELMELNDKKILKIEVDNTVGFHAYTLTNTVSGNTEIAEVEILENLEFSVDYDRTICKGESTRIELVPNTGNAEDYTYQWQTVDPRSMNCTNCSDPMITPTASSDYTVTISNTAGCTIEETVNVSVDAADVKIVGASTFVMKGTEIQLSAEGDFDEVLEWAVESATAPIATYNSKNLSHIIDGNSTINVFVTTANGCTDVASIFMQTREAQFMAPTGFSPNNDGMNEIFMLTNPEQFENCDNFEFCIFDRWGIEVFRTDDKSEGWNGEYASKVVGEKQANVGTYVYYMKAYCEDKLVKKQGTVTLIR